MKGNAQSTRPSLLLRMRDARNVEAWEQFVEIYTPLIYGFCRNHGLQEADASDVSQEVMRAVARAMEKFEYHPEKGKFRSWLLTVVRSKFNNFLASRQRQAEAAGQTTLQRLIDGQPTSAEQSDWDTEYHRRIFHWASEKIRPDFQDATWQAFWRTAIEQQDGKAVADRLGMTVGAVYVAKSRVLARLKEAIRCVDQDDEGPFQA